MYLQRFAHWTFQRIGVAVIRSTSSRDGTKRIDERQGHSWVRTKCSNWVPGLCMLLLATTQVIAQDSPKGKSLFDGKSLTGWSGVPGLWSVQDGAITGKSSADAPLKNNTFLVYEKPIKDFELTCEFKITGGNSGIQYRSKVLDQEKFIVGGYQADIATNQYMGINYEEKGRGIIATRGQIVTIDEKGNKIVIGSCGDPKELETKFNLSDWNKYKVIAKGNVCMHLINDHLMSMVIDNQVEKRSFEGVLALQLHTGPPMTIQFKNIMLFE